MRRLLIGIDGLTRISHLGRATRGRRWEPRRGAQPVASPRATSAGQPWGGTWGDTTTPPGE
jgi:hypothetical protein